MTYQVHNTKATYIALSPDDSQLAVSTNNGQLILWDLNRSEKITTIKREGWIVRLSWTPDGRLLAGNSDGVIGLYKENGLVGTLDSLHGNLRDLNVHPDGDRMVTCGGDGNLRVWNLQDLTLMWENGPSQAFNTAAFCNDMVVVGSQTGRFIVYTGPGKEGGLLNGNLLPWGLSALAVRPQGDGVVFGGEKGSIKSISTDQEKMWPNLLSWHNTPPKPISVNTMAFSPDGSRFLAACSDNSTRVFKWGTEQDYLGKELGKPFWLRSPNPGWSEAFIISSACWSPTGDQVYTCSFDGRVCLWTLPKEGQPEEETLFSVT